MTLEDLFVQVVGSNPIVQGLAGGVVIAVLNLLGAVLVLVYRHPTQRLLDGALGFAAGVMLAASFTSLILPGIHHPAGGVGPVLVGLALGAFVLDQADRWVPHVHVLVTGRARADRPAMGDLEASVVLFIVAITLHNMPEGLAVGIGFGSGDIANALSLMLAIGIQNIPEGLAVSVAAINAGFDRRFYAALAGIRAGLVEIPLPFWGPWRSRWSPPSCRSPWALPPAVCCSLSPTRSFPRPTCAGTNGPRRRGRCSASS